MKKSPLAHARSTVHSQRLALESRLVFDGAMVATATEVQADSADNKPVSDNSSAAVPSAPPVDFSMNNPPPVAVDYQPAADNTDNQPAFAVEPTQTASPVSGVSGANATTLIVVDPRADNAGALYSNPPVNTQVIVLDAARDGFQQVAELLQGRHDVTELNVLPWTNGNTQWLGNKTLTATLESSVSNELMHWGDGLTDNADIIFHGSTNLGVSWLSHIDALTGADTHWVQGMNFSPAPSRELIVVDTRIDNYQSLLTTFNASAAILYIDPSKDGIQQLVDGLKGRTDISALHIVSHGSQGSFTLGSSTLNSDNINSYQAQLADIGLSLSNNGDILFYGCEIAEDAAGVTFINQLANLTHADIAASNDATGNAAKGGDWVLEYHSGAIETVSSVASGYDGLLAAPVNTVPAAQSVAEDNSLTFGAGKVISIGDADGTVLTVDVSVAHGTLTLSGIAGLTLTGNGTGFISITGGTITQINAALNGLIYNPTANYSGADTLTIDTFDGATTDTDTVAITVTPNATALVLTLPNTVQIVQEDVSAYLNFTAINPIILTDADANDQQTLTLSVAHGTLLIKTNVVGGITTAVNNGTGTVTLTGTAAQLSATLADSQGIQYTSALNYNSSDPAFIATPETLSFSLSDGVVAHNKSGTVGINATPVNDAPSFTGSTPALAVEGGSVAFSLAQLASSANALDVDIQTGQQVLLQLAIKIDSLPVGGTLTYKDGAVEVGSVIPVTDLAKLVFTHDGTDIISNQTISFNVTVSDGGGGSTAGSMSVTVQPKNVAPVISGTPTLIEGQIKVVAPTINLGDAADTLATSTITIDNIITGGQGSFFIDADNDNVIDAGETLSGSITLDATQRTNLPTQLKFSQNGNEPNIPATISPSYRITVTDAGGATGIPSAAIAKTITLNVQPNNDDPTLLNTHASVGTALTAQEGNITAITAAMLKISDVDRDLANLAQTTPENQLVYTVETRPTQGEIQIFVGGGLGYGLDGWITLGDGGRFTQAQVAAGQVRYYQTTNVPDAVTTPDNFTFTVRDSAYGYDVWTDPANPVSNREGGLRATPTGVIATQQFFLGITPLAASNTPRTDVDPIGGEGNWEGAPRPATSGFGGSNMVYSFFPTGGMLSNNSTAGGSWQEANVNSPPGYVITATMLSYTITRTDTMGTPATGDDVSVTVPPNETVYTLTVQPSNGIIQSFASGSWQTVPTNAQFTQADINSSHIRFVHDGSEDHTSTFGYKVSDGTPNNYTSTFGLDITPTNDRPAGLGGLVKVNEKLLPTNDGLVRLGSSALGMSDVDLSLDITKQATPEGKQDFLWFKVIAQPADAGTTQRGELQRWNGSAWVTVTLGEWLPSTLLTTIVGGATSGLRYAHDGSEPLAYPTNPNVTFQYQVRDDLLNPNNPFATDTSAVADTSGSAQSNQSALATTTIQIIPVNNAPVIADKPGDADPTVSGTITGGGALTGVNQILTNVPEGGTVTITSAFLTAIDQDNTTVQRQYILTSLPTQGNLLLNNQFLGAFSTFTQDDIDNNRLTYRHNGSEFPTPTTDALGTYSDKFHFIVSDAVFYDFGANAPNYNTFLIDFGAVPNNDAPTIVAPTGIVDIDSATPANNLVTGFVIADPDLTNGVQAGETDFVQVTVRLLDSAGTPLTNYSTGFAGAGVNIGYTTQSGGLWAVTQTGINNILQLQGSRAQVNAALAGLSVTFANDANSMYKVQVIVDDRLRDAAGALNAAGNDANGGELNQSVTFGGTPTAVPSTVYDWSTTVAVPAVPNGNIAAATVDIRASRVNEIPTFTAPAAVTVLEDVRTLIPANFVIADPESAGFNTPVTVTLSIPAGQGTLDVATAGSAQTSFTPSGGQAVTISGDGTNSITLTGRTADIQALLNQRNFANTANDTNGGLYYSAPANGNHDYNAAGAGDVTLTLSLVDTGSRFGSDVGAGSVAANPADMVIPITITPINDAPTVTNANSAVPVAISGTTAVTGFVIGDPDNTDGGALNITTGEVDFIQATIRLVNTMAAPLPATGDAGGIDHSNVVFSSTSVGGATVDATYTGNGSALVIRGTMLQVNTYLSGLTVALSNGLTNNNATYRVQVIADDRLRDAAGVLNGSNAANGGLNSDGSTGTANVSGSVFNPYSTTTPFLPLNIASDIRSILSSGVNEAPVFAALDNTPTFVENGAPIVLDANATLTDPELSVYSNWNQAVLTLARNGGANSDDIFGVTGSGSTGINFSGANIRNGATVIGTFTNSAGTLAITFNSNATNANVNLVLQAITYSNANNTPPANITLNYTVNDSNTNTGLTPQGGANPTLALSGTGSITVGITPVNDAPTLSGLTGKTYTEDAAPVVIGTGVVLDDPELKTFAGGTGQWSNAYLVLSRNGGADANDVFSASGTLSALTEGSTLLDGAVTIGTVTQNTAGILTITFADGVTTAQAQAALGKIAYSNPIQSLAAAATSPVTLNWVLHDGDTDADRALNGQGTTGDKSVTFAQTITLTGVNDAPVLADTALSITQTEDAIAPVGAVGTLVSALTGGVSDVDIGNPKGIAITATDSTHGIWYYSTNNGTSWTTFTATNTTARLLAADANTRVYFQPTANWQGTGITSGLTIRAWDSSTGTNGGTAAQDLSNGANVGGTTAFSSATDVVAVTVTSVNDQPTATSDVVLPAILEDTLTPNGVLISGLAFNYSDATDNQTANGGGNTSTPFSYIAIVGSTGYNAAQGNWQVSTTATPNPAVASDWITIPVSGLSTSAALIFAADRQIRFVPATDFNGTPGTLQVRLADNNVDLTGTGKTSPNATTKFDLSLVANGGTGTTDAWNAVDRNISTTVTPVSDAPSGAGNLVTTNEDQTYTLTTANFGFSDSRDNPANTFTRVLITTLPASGTLKLNGVNVVAGDYILASDITAGKLTFVPTTDYNNTLTTATTTTTVSPALAIPDKTTVTSTLTISGASGNISDLNLALNISHTGVDDLIIKLTAPDGTVQTLYNRTGGGINANDLVVTFDDEAATSVTTIPNNGTTTTPGSYRPANPLTVFDGRNPNGTWTLSVTDAGNGDTGTLNSWSLIPTTVSTGLDFTFQVEDTGNTVNGGVILDPSPNAMIINVIPLNDAPVLTATPTNPIVTENATTGSGTSVDPFALFTGVSIGDIDLSTTPTLTSTVFGAGTITATLSDGITGDVLFINGGALPGISGISGGTGNTPLVITLGNSATLAQVETIIAALQYKSTSDNPTVNNTDNTRAYNIVVSDGNNSQGVPNAGGASALNSSVISGIFMITHVNDAPVVDLNGAVAGTDNAVTWTENSNVAHTAVAINPNATVADTDNTNMTQLIMQVGGVQDGNNEVLNIGGVNFLLNTTVSNVAAGGFLVSYNSGTGTFTILPTPTSIALASSYQTLIQGITYINNTDNVTAGNRTVSFNITDAGFDNSTAVGGELGSNTPTTTINVVRANDQPVITNLNAISYFENAINAAAAIIDGSITLTDIDSPTYNGGTLTVSGLIAAQDTVSLPVGAAAVSGNIQINGGNVEYYDGAGWVVIGTHSGGVGANFVVSFNASATPAIVQRVIENLTFANSSNNPTLSRTLNLALNDGGTGTVQNATVGVTIKLDNDAPVMTAATLGGTYTEQNATPLQFISGAISVSDPDSPANFYINVAAVAGSLTVALDGYQTGDTLSVVHQGNGAGQIGVVGNTISYGGTAFATTSGGNGAPLVISFTSATATPAAVQALLAQLAFSNTTNEDPTVNNTDPSRVFTVTLNDGGNTKDTTSSTTALTATLTGTINLTAVNDKPVITPAGTPAAYTENALAVTVDNTVTVTDVDDTQMNGGTISITGNFLAGDVLAVTDTGNITGSYNAATGVLTLSGLDTIANYQAVLRSLTYLNSTDDPTDNTTKTTRTLTYSLTDANSDAVGAATSIAATKTINITPLQDAPVMSGGGTLTYTEQSPAAVIDATVTVFSDADDTLMSGATITLSAGYTAGDILSFTAQNGISVVSNTGGVLVLTGNATLANYTAALRSITFNSTSDTPTIISATRTVSWQVRDANSDAAGVASSNTVTSTINILALNDTPVFTGLGNTVSFTEVGTAVVLNTAVTVADVDLSPLSGGAGNYNGTTLTLMRNGGANAEDVFSSTGTLAALTQGGNVTVGGTTIGTVTTNLAGTLVLTFNTNATSALVNSALQQITYRNNSATPQASVQINWLFNDQNPNITGGGTAGGGQDQGGGGVLTASGSTTITIDRLPTANADTNSIAENALNVTGNVITGATTTDDQGDPAATVTGVATGTPPSTSGSVNTPIAGSYGSLTLDSTGGYTYTLDNANPLVNKLLTGQTLLETYSYTITDADGDTSTTTLKITINGVTDGAPSVVPVDGNGGAVTGEATVFEKGLVAPTDNSQTTTGTLTVTAPDGMASVTIGGTTFTVAQLATFSVGSPSAAINTGEGTLKVTGFTIGTGAASAPTAGTLSYTYTLNATQAHTGGAAVTESVDTIALVVTDATTAANTSTGTLTVRIVDDTPTANADTNSITENAATTTGNVFGAGSGGDIADRIGADVTATPVTGVASGIQASTSGNVNTPVAGSYGSLTLNATGGYTYTLDNSNAAVNALRTGQTLTDTYSYTITDADGDTSTAKLTITINGATDGAPVITPLDGNGAATGEATVFEKGLVAPTDNTQTTTGTLTVSVPDGMASVTIGGTTFTVAQLATFSVGSPSTGINTGEGTLKVTGFTVTTGTTAAPTAGSISYSYTLNANQAHTGGAAVTESVDTIALIVTDATTAATQATGTLTVRIVDDTPTANADLNSIAEDTATKSGNVFSGSSPDVADRLGADVTATPVTGVASGTQASTSGNVGSAIAGSYGSLTLNADGSYTYTLDNTNPLVNKLLTGNTLLETYSYTITDSDGDTSTTTLKITINGTTDNIPSIVPVDSNGGLITGVLTVQESGLTSGADTSETNTGTLTLSALDGLAGINVGGTAITLVQLNNLGTTPITVTTPKGTITLTGYNSTASVGGVSTAGTLNYSYTLVQVQNTPAATENTDDIPLSITNAGGNTVTNTLSVQIVDDEPTANPDVNSVSEGNSTAATSTSGNVFLGDTPTGADRIGADVTATPVTAFSFGATNGTLGNPLNGNYGSLTLNADGSYTYTLDNTNPAVNALLNGQTLLEIYSYTITDADGDTSTTTLKITINGFTDSSPEITPIDGNNTETGQATVFEKGLVAPTDNSQTTTGTISVSTPDGMASVTIGGTTFTVAQLATFSVGSPSVTINTGEGTLVVTGFNIVAGPNAAPTAGTLSYRYTLNAAQPHTGGSAVAESTDRITLVVTDSTSQANTATSTLIARIVDDTPTAKADTNSVIEGTTTAATSSQGNVFGAIGAAAGDVADRIGADTTLTPVTGVSFAGSVKTVGSPFNSAYGSLTLNANGSYIYTLDNTNAIVNALGLGQTLSETFSYTVTDADGDTSTTTLTITINGRNDAPIAVNDIQTGSTGQPVIINVLGNDRDPENNINPATVKIVGTVNAGDSLEVAGQGIWSVNRLTGAITFTPFTGFTADPTPISYTITDRTGLTSNPATVSVDYPQTPPLATDNTVTGVTGRPVTITVLDNDSDPENDINPATLHIAGTANAGDSLVVAGQGTWSVDVNTGSITFTPDLGFTGSPTPISYTVSDNTGFMSNTARVTVNYPTVIATDTGTSGSLMMLSNPDKTDSSSKYNEEEKKASLESKFKHDNQLPPARLSLYVPIRHYVISLTGSLRDQLVLELERYSFSIPRWMFRHTDPNEQLEFEAARPDGSSLPEWLTFNPKTLKFSGVPPKGAHNERVMVTARDSYGNEVHATFNVHVNKERMRSGLHHKVFDKHKLGEKRTVGKAGLSEQIHAMGKFNKLQESRALLDSFKSVVSLVDD